MLKAIEHASTGTLDLIGSIRQAMDETADTMKNNRASFIP